MQCYKTFYDLINTILRCNKYDFTDYDVKSDRFYNLRFYDYVFFYNIDAYVLGVKLQKSRYVFFVNFAKCVDLKSDLAF